MLILLAIITIAATFTQIFSYKRMRRYVEKEMSAKPLERLPKATVILPCRGLDSDFEINMRKLLTQKYLLDGKPHFEVIFAVGSTDDPAYAPLKRLSESSDQVRVQLVVAPPNPTRGNKINNQLTALKEIPEDTEVLVFVDSDVIARDDFLSYLVSHLDDPTVGATTGYRFYIPFRGDWPSLLRSLWNRMSAWELASPRYSFAWGGAMAIRRDTFVKARVAEHWDKSADDDLSLTTAVKALGLTVRFVPQCLVVSDGDATIPEIIEWTNRQLILTKVYYRELWMRAIIRAIILTVWLFAVIGATALAILDHQTEHVCAAIVGLMLMPIELFFLINAQGLWLEVLALNKEHELGGVSSDSKTAFKQIQIAYNKSLPRFSMVIPLAHLVLPWVTLYSVLTNRIKWRGIIYELRSPTETVII